MNSTTDNPSFRNPAAPICGPLGKTLLLLCLLALYACAPAPKRPPAPVTEAGSEAQAAMAAGDFAASAQLYHALAEGSAEPLRFDYRLRALDAELKSADWEAARATVTALPRERMQPQQRLQLMLLEARLLLGLQQAAQALNLLRPLPADASVAIQIEYHELRADAYTALNRQLDSARERVWLEGLLADPARRSRNHWQTWDALSTLDDQALRQRIAPPPDALSGWMELVLISRRFRREATARDQAIATWRLQYPGHPANESLLPELLQRLAESGTHPQQLAVLLPLSGRYAGAAEAVRDGLLAAYYAQPEGERTGIEILDVGDQPAAVWGVYQRAVANGADFVIGPLSKEGVAELARAGNLEVPVLALNQLGDVGTGAGGLYQFGLAPEDEAEAVARHARELGYERSIALVPAGAWGERVLGAFSAHWQALGGALLEVQYYSNDPKTFSDSVRALLNVDASKQRQQALVRQLGQTLEFEPRRRKDADFVFLVAAPQQARQLQPLLRFHHAADLPVLATSHVYTGTPDPDADKDLNGLRFCDIPWTLQEHHPGRQLQQALQNDWPTASRRYTRLQALGVDAFQLLPYLRGPSGTVSERIPGVTGNLQVMPDGRIKRDLVWAEMRAGLPDLIAAEVYAPGLTSEPYMPEEEPTTTP